jgi:hypothetical protein
MSKKPSHFLSSYEEECQEIELEDTSNYLRTVIESCEDRMKTCLQLPTPLLQNLLLIQEQLKKTPLNVETFTTELTEKINESPSFLQEK